MGCCSIRCLMAADILLYQAAIVPVGEDQAQHLELTRDIAQRFNSLYGDTFKVPATHLPAVGARVMGLDEPDTKMSKSAAGSGHAIAMLDTPDQARKKIMRATTDSNPAVDFETMGPGVRNLLGIFQAFSEWPDEKMRDRFSGMRYGDLKKQVAEMVISHLEPFQKRYNEIVVGRRIRGRDSQAGMRARVAHCQFHRRCDEATHGPLLPLTGIRSPRLAATNRNFRLLWFAQIVSELGDWLYTVAVFSLLLEFTGKAQSIALAFVLQVLPQFFISPSAGILNDRISRKKVMIFADWMRAAIVLCMIFVRTPAAVPLLYVLLVLETVLWALFEPGHNAVIPNITSKDEVVTANALSATTWSFNFTMGFAVGGVLAAFFGRDIGIRHQFSVVRGFGAADRPHAFFRTACRKSSALTPARSGRLLADSRGHSLRVEGPPSAGDDIREVGLGLMGANWVLLPLFGERVFQVHLAGFSARQSGMLGMSLLMACRGLGAILGPVLSGYWAGGKRQTG